jgi:hypothetical protein
VVRDAVQGSTAPSPVPSSLTFYRASVALPGREASGTSCDGLTSAFQIQRMPTQSDQCSPDSTARGPVCISSLGVPSSHAALL